MTSLFIETHSCSGERRASEPLVLLHGWGNDSRTWQPILPKLSSSFDVITVDLPGFGKSRGCQTWQQALELMIAQLPEKFLLMGWSLGGMLGVQLAKKFPKRVVKLVTLASNATYVSRTGWNKAMPVGLFDDFYQNFVSDPDTCVKKFCALESMGDSEQRALMRWFRDNSADILALPWLVGLDWLKQLDNREALASIGIPSLHIFGQTDALVPVSAAEKIRKLSKNLKVEIIDGAGHAPHISQPEKVASTVGEFLTDTLWAGERYRLHKQQVALSFGKAADSYDSVAQLQRDVGDRLMALLPADFTPEFIADIGCGTGHFTGKLASRFSAHCTGIDLAPGMISYAAKHHQPSKSLEWQCGDAEALPVEDRRFGLLYSNFTYQWCQNLQALMAEQWRALQPGGYTAFTTVGPHSLWQLRDAWQQVDEYVHVNRFSPLEDVRSALEKAGFEILHWQEETITRYYAQLNGLTRELKALGAHNVNSGRNSALTGRKRIAALKVAYEAHRCDLGLPADWQVAYVIARKAEL